MTKGTAGPTTSPPSAGEGSFNDLMAAFQAIRVPLAGEDAGAREERRRAAIRAMIEGKFTDAQWRHLMGLAHAAAERGERECLLLRAPAASCSDHGRAIIEQEAGWPATLSGDAASLYRRWHEELRPQGFHLDARMLGFPGGMPGDFGLFLRWRA